MRSALIAVLAVTASAGGDDHPYSLGGGGEFGSLTDHEKEAVGGALENALGVLSGKTKSGSMFDICTDLFASGPPADKKSATWQACKGVLPATGSLIAYKQAIVKQGGAKHPLTGAEKATVGEALNKALGVMSGKIKGGSKFATCSSMFPNGPPADAATSVTWTSCKGELGYKKSALLSHLREVKEVKKVAGEPDLRTLSGSEKQAVGAALENALGVLSGKVKSGDKFSICSNMFPNGAPTAGAKDPSWVACQDSLPNLSAYGSLLSWKAAVVAKGGAKHPLSEHEKAAVGDALGEALSVMSGKTHSGSKSSICSHMFPNGAPSDAATSVTWKTCASTLR